MKNFKIVSIIIVTPIIIFIGIYTYINNKKIDSKTCTMSLMPIYTFDISSKSCKATGMASNGCYKFKKNEYYNEELCLKENTKQDDI